MNWKGLTPPYGTIVVDPPWSLEQPPRGFGPTAQGGKRPAGAAHRPLPYSTMSIDQIAALPVADLAADHAYLYLWTVNRFIVDTYRIVRGWGFTPRMLLTWCKEPIGVGPGGDFASTTEFVLLAKRGSGNRAATSRIDRNWWVWPRGRHSEKPSAFLDIVEQVSPAPYVELFARQPRFGWDSWGKGYEVAS